MLSHRKLLVFVLLVLPAVLAVVSAEASESEVAYYFTDNGSWQTSQPFVTADVNGNGTVDVVGFTASGTRVGLTQGWHEWRSASWTGDIWVANYGANYGWTTASHIRTTGDVNGDGRDDVVGFGQDGVYVSISRPGQRKFDAPQRWLANFGFAQGYRVAEHPRFVADVNGDGKDDLVAFAADGVRVSLSNGTAFSTPKMWIGNYGTNYGWTAARHIRAMGDINGDGRADVVGFGQDGVWISFSADRSFSAPQRLLANLAHDAGNYRIQHPRMVADVDGDGRADLIGIKPGSSDSVMKVRVARSRGSSFATVTTEDWWLTEPVGQKRKAGDEEEEEGATPRYSGGFAARHFLACDIDGTPGAELFFFDQGYMRRFGDQIEAGAQ